MEENNQPNLSKGAPNKIKTSDILEQLKLHLENIDKLPPHAMSQPLNQYDLYSMITMMEMIVRHFDPSPSAESPPQKTPEKRQTSVS